MPGKVVVEEAVVGLEPEFGVVFRSGRHDVGVQQYQPHVRPSVS
jgi:hypothetical protein